MIDLHVHTDSSDGTLSPGQVVRLAARLKLCAVAITDHDTIDGIKLAQEAASAAGIEVVPGVELSVRWNPGSLHILGYLIDTENSRLLDALGRLKSGREERTGKMLAKLADIGIRVTRDEVAAVAQGGVHGRPHLAQVLVNKGIVRAPQEAFDRYLRRGGPAYAEKVKLEPAHAVETILGAGGIAVIAHPYSLETDDPDRLEQIVGTLAGYGVQGIEVFYPKHSRRQTATFLSLAERFGLVATGGTDFHGALTPAVELGVIRHGGPLPYSIIDALRERASANHRGSG
ncbi:MAG: PHP domain-containing protein [Thermodesulfobacteriota bacterium]